jgi:hypothetical protein
MEWRCPQCRQKVEVQSLDDLPYLPFCSERCKMVDLHGWLTDRYKLSRPVEEGDLGEATPADLESPPGQDDKKKPLEE